MSGQDLLLSQGALAAMTAVSLAIGLLLGGLYSILRWLSTFLEADTYRTLLRRISEKEKNGRRTGRAHASEAIPDGMPENTHNEAPPPLRAPSRWPPRPPEEEGAAQSTDEPVTESATPTSRKRAKPSQPRSCRPVIGITDFLWTVLSWIALILVLYYTNDGQLRAPAPVSMAVGILLYRVLLGKWAERVRVPVAVAALYPLYVLLTPLRRAAEALRHAASKKRKKSAKRTERAHAVIEQTNDQNGTGKETG